MRIHTHTHRRMYEYLLIYNFISMDDYYYEI
jgi:hypothetical protein